MAAPGQPKLVFAPVCDYTTGYLVTYGALLALARRACEGGSWQVNVSLGQSAMLLQGPVLRMSETPTRWDRPTPELGSDDAAWLPRMA